MDRYKRWWWPPEHLEERKQEAEAEGVQLTKAQMAGVAVEAVIALGLALKEHKHLLSVRRIPESALVVAVICALRTAVSLRQSNPHKALSRVELR